MKFRCSLHNIFGEVRIIEHGKISSPMPNLSKQCPERAEYYRGEKRSAGIPMVKSLSGLFAALEGCIEAHRC